MFKDEKFQTNYKIDKRGKPIKYSTNDDLKKYYELSSSDDSDDDETDEDKEEEENDEDEVNISGRFVRPPPASDDDIEIQGEPITDTIRKKLRNPNVSISLRTPGTTNVICALIFIFYFRLIMQEVKVNCYQKVLLQTMMMNQKHPKMKVLNTIGVN